MLTDLEDTERELRQFTEEMEQLRNRTVLTIQTPNPNDERNISIALPVGMELPPIPANASGPLSDINVPKVLQPKGLYLVRPAMQQYLSTREELDEASKVMFEKISSGKVKINIFKKYKLDQVIEAHKDLEGRKILGPAVILP